MRLIDAESSELQTQLKIIREAEYQIYGSGSWGFTAKCEHAIDDAPTVQYEPHWIPVTEKPIPKGLVLVTYNDGDVDLLRQPTAYRRGDIVAWCNLPEPYKEVTT